LDTLQKLVGHWKTIVAMGNLMVESVFALKIQFITNKIYIGRGNELINLEFMNTPKKKLIQFANIFHLLRVGRSMTKVEAFINLYMLNVNDNLKKNWIDNIKWGALKIMHEVIFINTIIIL
jgi:hypothetical protein